MNINYDKKVFSLADVERILNRVIKREMESKNAYIKRNRYSNKDALNAFDSRIAAITYLPLEFKLAYIDNEKDKTE